MPSADPVILTPGQRVPSLMENTDMAKKKATDEKPAAKKPSKKDSELLVPTRYTIPPCPMSRRDTLAYVDKLKKEL